MFLMWGWRTRLKTVSQGEFFSPAAGRDCPYRLVEARRWFTLFFLPVIPLKVLGTYVECSVTKRLYDPSILDNPTNAEFTVQLAGGVRETLVAVAMADGVVTDEERRVATEIIRGYEKEYDSETLDGDIARVATAPLDDRLAYLSRALTPQGKERLLTAAATVMTADGSIDDRARVLVRHIGEQLGMSAAHVLGVIETAAAKISQA